jgi:uncharacterized membrane protein
MNDSDETISGLQNRLESLARKQEDFSREINLLRFEIICLKRVEQEKISQPLEMIAGNVASATKAEMETREEIPVFIPFQEQPLESVQAEAPVSVKPLTWKSDLERFIGENLINKIGIIITVIGVAIGAKYSIENNLISPATRIIFGYLFSLGLLGIGYNLKRKYENYSSVLVSGAMAIMYFITFSAYALYGMLPQMMAFLLMVVLTVFTVLAALDYNRQVIAHLGLVGAYAIPFLLSEGAGNPAILFSYMAIINIGILAIAFRKYWKLLYYVSFGITWLIYLVWFVSGYEPTLHFNISLFFLGAFFTTFYLIFLAYKIIRGEKFNIDDTILLLANSFLFYGFGYSILNSYASGENWLGAFTLGNAIVHLIVCSIIYSRKLADRNLFYLLSGLVLVFLTIAVPVQLNGNWVTLLWVGKAALLFWIGRTRNVYFYEKLSYPLMILAFLSIIHDWATSYGRFFWENPETHIISVMNVHFLSSLWFIASFGFINYINQTKKIRPTTDTPNWFTSLLVPGILLFSLYFSFRMEIANHWNQLYADSAIRINDSHILNNDLSRFKTIWIFNYALLFTAILSFINIIKLRNYHLGFVSMGLIILALAMFLTQGLYEMSELRTSYLEQHLSAYYTKGISYFLIRYISLAFVVLSLIAGYRIISRKVIQKEFKPIFDFVLHITILWIATSELIHWMDMATMQSYKLGISILWGTYALLLIGLGIWKKNKPLRIGAIVLFGATLFKLFFYDISHLDTLSKTIVFVSLGVLLLIISFLYNKYSQMIGWNGWNGWNDG